MTPGRTTRLLVGEYASVVTEPAFAYARAFNEIVPAKGSNNVERSPLVGWRLKSKLDDIRLLYESDAGQVAFLPEGMIQAAGGMLRYFGNRPSSVTGVGGSGYTAPSAPGYRKSIAAGASFDNKLDADQTAYPNPTNTDTAYPLDRVLKTTEWRFPDMAIWFTLSLPHSMSYTSGPIASVGFSGPSFSLPQSNQPGVQNEGTGEWFVTFYGNGFATLSARIKDTINWRNMDVFRWADYGAAFGRRHAFIITTDCFEGCNGVWTGTKIAITRSTLGELSANGSYGLFNALQDAALLTTNQKIHTLRVPGAKNRPCVTVPIRVDLRRDVRARVELASDHFAKVDGPIETNPDGLLIDQAFTLPLVPIEVDQPFILDWYGYIPPGTKVIAKMYEVSDTGDTEIVGEKLQEDCIGQAWSFPIAPTKRVYRVGFALESNSAASGFEQSRRSPVIREYRIYRAPVERPAFSSGNTPLPNRYLDGGGVGVISLPAAEIVSVESVGPSEDPDGELTQIVVEDLTGQAEFLKNAAGKPYRLEVIEKDVYDPGNPDITCVIASGIIRAVQEVPDNKDRSCKVGQSRSNGQYPSKKKSQYTLICQGEVARLKRQLSPMRFPPYETVDGQQLPLKVTELLKFELDWAGYSGRYTIPDKPIRLFPSGLGDDAPAFIEANEPLAPLAVSQARDYLASYLVWEPNEGA